MSTHSTGFKRGASGLAVAVALFSSQGCTSHSTSGSPMPAPRTASVWLASPVQPASAGDVLKDPKTFDIAEPSVSNLRIWSHYLAFSASSPASAQGNPDHVEVIDLDTGQRRTVAHTRYAHGMSDWLAGTGDYVVWTDQPAEQSDDTPQSTWTIHLTSLTTGSDREIGRSKQADVLVPTPTAADGVVAWVQLHAAESSLGDIHVYSIAAGTDQVAASGLATGDVEVGGGRLVYSLVRGRNRDIYSMPVAGGPATRLSTDGQAVPAHVAGGRAVWQEPLQGEPTSIWYADVTGKPAASKVVDGPNRGNAVLVGSYIAYWADAQDRLTLAPVGGGAVISVPQQGPTAVPARMASDGHRLVWGEYPAQGTGDSTTIHLASIG